MFNTPSWISWSIIIGDCTNESNILGNITIQRKGRHGVWNTAQRRCWYHSTIGAIFFDVLLPCWLVMDKMDLDPTATGRPFRSIPMALLTLGVALFTVWGAGGLRTAIEHDFTYQWIGLRENLQETIEFPNFPLNRGFPASNFPTSPLNSTISSVGGQYHDGSDLEPAGPVFLPAALGMSKTRILGCDMQRLSHDKSS